MRNKSDNAKAGPALWPVPIPAGTAAAGRLVAFWLARRVKLVATGVVAGVLIGVAVHVWVHLTVNSTLPAEELLLHAAVDGAKGVAVATVVVLVMLALWVLSERLGGRGRPGLLVSL